MEQLTVKSNKRVELIDITPEIEKIIYNQSIDSGVLFLYVPHTTAAITINESADPSVKSDIIKELNKVIPFEDNYSHIEGNSAAHIKSSLIGCSEYIIISDAKPVLGRWQGIFFCEFDGPRKRKIDMKVLKN
ncbi:MAG: secondary thiamine-phosphate synthase enzyme YjbQ [Halanaerobiales bacterium]